MKKCTQYFFQQAEKHKNSKQDMLSITRIKDGKLLTNQKEILKEVKNFYANLYANNQNDVICGQISTTQNKTKNTRRNVK